MPQNVPRHRPLSARGADRFPIGRAVGASGNVHPTAPSSALRPRTKRDSEVGEGIKGNSEDDGKRGESVPIHRANSAKTEEERHPQNMPKDTEKHTGPQQTPMAPCASAPNAPNRERRRGQKARLEASPAGQRPQQAQTTQGESPTNRIRNKAPQRPTRHPWRERLTGSRPSSEKHGPTDGEGDGAPCRRRQACSQKGNGKEGQHRGQAQGARPVCVAQPPVAPQRKSLGRQDKRPATPEPTTRAIATGPPPDKRKGGAGELQAPYMPENQATVNPLYDCSRGDWVYVREP